MVTLDQVQINIFGSICISILNNNIFGAICYVPVYDTMHSGFSRPMSSFFSMVKDLSSCNIYLIVDQDEHPDEWIPGIPSY